MNQGGPPARLEPNDQLPEGPPAPIKKRSGPPDDTGKHFERQPERPPDRGSQGAYKSDESFDFTTTSGETTGDTAAAAQPRLVRQSASAGFHTVVVAKRNGRLVAGRWRNESE
jgi:hypothetical protein